MASLYKESAVYPGFKYNHHRIDGYANVEYQGDYAIIKYMASVDAYYGYQWGMGMSVEIYDPNGNRVHHNGNFYGVLTWNPGASWQEVIHPIYGEYKFYRPTDASGVSTGKYKITIYEWGATVSGYGPARNNISVSANLTIQPRALNMPNPSDVDFKSSIEEITVGKSKETTTLSWNNLLSKSGGNKKYNANFWAYVLTDCTESIDSIDVDLPDNVLSIIENWNNIISKKETASTHHIIYKTNRTNSDQGNTADNSSLLSYSNGKVNFNFNVKQWIDQYYGGNYNEYYKKCTYGGKQYGYVYIRLQEYHEWSSANSGYFPHTDAIVAIKYNSGLVTAYDSTRNKHKAIVWAYDNEGKRYSTLVTAYCSEGDGHKVI